MKALSREMLRVLRLLKREQAAIAWKGYTYWLTRDGKLEMHLPGVPGGNHVPAISTVEALEKRGLLERHLPTVERGYSVYRLTPEGVKQAEEAK